MAGYVFANDVLEAILLAVVIIIGALVGYVFQATALPDDEPGAGPADPAIVRVPADYNPHPMLFIIRGLCCCRVRSAFRRDEPVPKLPNMEMRREVALDPAAYEKFHRHFVPEASFKGSSSAGKMPLFITYPNVAGEVMGIASLAHPSNPLPAIPFPVHVRQRIEMYRDVAVDERDGCAFTVIARAPKLVPVDSGLELRIVFDAEDASGKLFSRSTFVGLYKYAGRPKRAAAGDGKAVAAAAAAAPPDVQVIRRRDAAGKVDPTESWDVPAGTGATYAALSGDFNPIHVSDTAARLLGGFRGAIIHGKWTLAKACAALRRKKHLIPTDSRGVFVECTFRSPVVMPGKAHFGEWSSDSGNTEFAVWGAPRKRRNMDEMLDDVFCYGSCGTVGLDH